MDSRYWLCTFEEETYLDYVKYVSEWKTKEEAIDLYFSFFESFGGKKGHYIIFYVKPKSAKKTAYFGGMCEIIGSVIYNRNDDEKYQVYENPFKNKTLHRVKDVLLTNATNANIKDIYLELFSDPSVANSKCLTSRSFSTKYVTNNLKIVNLHTDIGRVLTEIIYKKIEEDREREREKKDEKDIKDISDDIIVDEYREISHKGGSGRIDRKKNRKATESESVSVLSSLSGDEKSEGSRELGARRKRKSRTECEEYDEDEESGEEEYEEDKESLTEEETSRDIRIRQEDEDNTNGYIPIIIEPCVKKIKYDTLDDLIKHFCKCEDCNITNNNKLEFSKITKNCKKTIDKIKKYDCVVDEIIDEYYHFERKYDYFSGCSEEKEMKIIHIINPEHAYVNCYLILVSDAPK